MITLPPETWLHVARFMPYSDLRNMLSVNSTFFQLAMNARYYEVEFTSFNDKDNLRFLRRLRHPDVARRVRRLRVLAQFEDTFKDKYIAGYSFYKRQDTHEGPWNLRRALDTIDNSLDKVVFAMTETVTDFTNITHFEIRWCHIAPSVECLRPLLTASWGAIGSSVRILELTISSNYMPGLISTAMTGTFTELRELQVTCQTRNSWENEELPTTSMATIVAQFVDKVAPTLRSLSLRTLTPELELFSLFNELGHIPHLEQLCTRARWCESHFAENSTCLSRFLQSHAATLRAFYWEGPFPTDEFRSSDGRSKDELMVDFLSGNRLDGVFSNLLELEFPVPSSDVGYGLLLRYIKGAVSTLNYLTLSDGYLTYDRVAMLVSSLKPGPGGHPKDLTLLVEVLSPELVLLLAQTCPHLEALEITTLYLSPINDNRQSIHETAEEQLSDAREFAHRLREYDFRDWSLNDIYLKQASDSNITLYARIMLLFGECIPSVQKFEGSYDKPSCIRDIPDDELRL